MKKKHGSALGKARALIALLLCWLVISPTALSQEALPLPSGPGDSGRQVLALSGKLIELGYLEGEAGLFYSRQVTRAVAAYQKDMSIPTDGRANRETLLALFSQPASPPGTTEMPHWFAGGENLIPWGAVFEVKDVETGQTFSCQRMEGFAHMDVEPLTEKDTKVILKLYNNTWSWDRRPILVRYAGRVFAASMNGMPHGYHAIRDNGMPGHFCIHFFFSRNHGNLRVNPTHLESVLEANETSW